MSAVRVLVGTRKGAFVLTADGQRTQWEISGPHFGGWEIYHVKGSPVDPQRIYASQTSSWFGQVMQRSDDGGVTWEAAGNQFDYLGDPGTHQWYDGTPRPWEFKRIWHLEPALHEAEMVYAGAEDAALFRSTDGGHSWEELAALRDQQGARAGSRVRVACACTPSCRRRAIPTDCTSRFPRRAPFALTMAARAGNRSTAA